MENTSKHFKLQEVYWTNRRGNCYKSISRKYSFLFFNVLAIVLGLLILKNSTAIK